MSLSSRKTRRSIYFGHDERLKPKAALTDCQKPVFVMSYSTGMRKGKTLFIYFPFTTSSTQLRAAAAVGNPQVDVIKSTA